LLQASLELEGHAISDIHGSYLIGEEGGRAFAFFGLGNNDNGGCNFAYIGPGDVISGAYCGYHTIYSGETALVRNRLQPDVYLYGGMLFEFGRLAFPDFPTSEFGIYAPVRYTFELAAMRGEFYGGTPTNLFNLGVAGRGEALLWFTGYPLGDDGWAFELQRAELELGQSTPEPATMALLGSGLGLLGLVYRRRRGAAAAGPGQ
jgi:hypothetical protein